MLKIESISKVYQTKTKSNVEALKNVSLDFSDKGLVFILGQSGSGKTTLLNIIGGLDQQTSGKIIIENNLELGKDLSFEDYRKNYIGFVFQEYNLIEDINVFDNISLAVTYPNKTARANAVEKILKDVALEGYEKRRISELSGGQKQRVAIARALAQNSKILLCDEPTGNLDSETGKEIFDLLKKISKDKLVIVVSHNEEMATEYANRIIKIKDGSIQVDSFDKEPTLSDTKVVNFENKNKVSLLYKLKCGFVNLFVQKFKTSIAFLLLFLSVFTMCLMQICLSYNSEQAIAKSFNNESSVIIIKNSSTNNDVLTISERYTLENNLNTFMETSSYADGYRIRYGTIFILDDINLDIIDSKEFYFKNGLSDGAVYVTDYFIDLVVNKDNNYSSLIFEDYTQLANAEIAYNGHTLFNIAGIIKTDYKDFYDERGNEKSETNNLNVKSYLNYKLNYQYTAIYALDNTFEKLYLENSSIAYSRNDGYFIKAQEGNYSVELNSIRVSDIQRANPLFYLSSGNFGICELDKSYEHTVRREIAEDEIVINGALYNYIFGTNIDWEDFYRQFYIAIDSGSPLENALVHLNKMISVIIENSDGEIMEIQNKKVIGVSSDFSIGKENSYAIYGLKEDIGLTNKLLSKHYVSEVNWQKISNKNALLKSLRDNSILVAGTKASLIYEKEYIVSQMSYFLIGVAGVISIIALISIFNLVNAKIRDKKKEIGILLAIGLKKSEVNFIYMISILIMMLLSILITIGLLYLTIYIINSILIVELFGFISYFNASWLTYIVIVLTCFVMFLISLFPLIRITKQKPVEIIKN